MFTLLESIKEKNGRRKKHIRFRCEGRSALKIAEKKGWRVSLIFLFSKYFSILLCCNDVSTTPLFILLRVFVRR